MNYDTLLNSINEHAVPIGIIGMGYVGLPLAIEFSKKFKRSKFFKPLIAVPSTYSKVSEKKLINNGFKVVIYANQLLRSAYPAPL